MRKLFGTPLGIDWRIAVITIISTLLILFDYYQHTITPWKYLDRAILYGMIPLLIILFIFRENPREYGFGLGDWKLGLL